MKEMYKNLFISENSSLLDALKLMDKNKVKLLIVCEGDKFFNLISIGDIQRAILRNISLETKIEDVVVNRKPIVGSIYDNPVQVRNKMLELRLEYMPILDENGKVCNVVFWQDLFSKDQLILNKNLDTPVIVMAGGKGERLKPFTNIIPKPLIPIGEKPVILRIIDNFLKYNIKKFYITLNYKGDFVKFYFDTIEKNYEVFYIEEEQPLGTVGSLFLLKEYINKTFFLTNCDILIDEDYSQILEFHKKHKNTVTIVGAIKNFDLPYGHLELNDEGKLVAIKEKPNLTYLINTGMYILEPEIFSFFKQKIYMDFTDFMEMLLKENCSIGVYPINENSWVDIGEWQYYWRSVGSVSGNRGKYEDLL